MADDPDDDLATLKRRAFSRSGTPDDLRRLRELAVPPEVEPPADEPEAQAEPDPVPVDEAAPPTPPRSRRPILIAAAAGLLAGATIATLGILLPRAAEPEPDPEAPLGSPTALAIFDREPTERDDPTQLVMTLAHILPSGLQDAELRWLGTVADHDVYVARGTNEDTTTICLNSARADSTGADCTEPSEFEVSGLNLGDGELELRWGPLGTEIWVTVRES